MSKKEYEYEVIIVGAGHAGIEAALASSRMGAKTLILNINLDTIGWAPCNPAVGGPAKGIVVREIDALGGEMAKTTDDNAINIRELNTSKGPAVRALRAQIDKFSYSAQMKKVLEGQENLTLQSGIVKEISIKNGKVSGLTTHFGIEYKCNVVIITAGTFLRGKIFVGRDTLQAGRLGEFPSNELSESLIKLGIKLERFKTGTPARVLKNSINFDEMEKQSTSSEPLAFSFFREKYILQDNYPCWLTHTNENTHMIIKRDISFSPLYGDVKLIKGTGPRYCPSLEDKVIKFSERTAHHVFVEPEGRNSNEYYLNGVSTSLPIKTQYEFLRTIKGLENVEIVRPAYAVEYDYIIPTQLSRTLEYKNIENLYFAGQVNGTSGYEEAAGQGLLAGINAVAKLRTMEPFVMNRGESYIGVMIDDLITRGVLEPYRLLTSRAEYRLILRHDNAHIRLTDYGYKYGLIPRWFYDKVNNFKNEVQRQVNRIDDVTVRPSGNLNNLLLERDSSAIYQSTRMSQLLKRPKINYEDLKKYDDDPIEDSELVEQVQTSVKYEGYIARLMDDVKRVERLESDKIPLDINYEEVPHISTEARERLKKILPNSLGQAMRIPGITTNDIINLSMYIKNRNKL
jgi:tRNA uridine 5-carboxymethylaminomethyl modification enzyme